MISAANYKSDRALGMAADACPRCLAVNRPLELQPDRGSLKAYYRCCKCHKKYVCWWDPGCLR